MELKIQYQDALVSEQEISDVVSPILPYLGALREAKDDGKYIRHESSIHLPFDTSILQKVKETAEAFETDSPKYVIVVGIGGSNLGAQAIYEAIRPKLSVALSRKPRIIFSDTNNPREAEALKNFLEQKVVVPSDAVLNIVTKSGTTTETVANASFILDLFTRKFGEEAFFKQVVITTDEGSALWNIAEEKGLKTLSLPKIVGGRYSVFSAVGLFPLVLAGINAEELLAGARDITDRCLDENVLDNPAWLSAAIVSLSQKKYSICNSFFFNSEMEAMGKWWRQLAGESLGKKKDFGITPMVSIGSTDLHSMVQLYFGGPRDKFTDFVFAVGGQKTRALVPNDSLMKPLNADIFGKDFADIMNAIFVGTKEAYKEHGLPFKETILPDMSEHALGQYMQMKMIETMIVAKMWEMDAFDQPDVESYKKVTKELLKH